MMTAMTESDVGLLILMEEKDLKDSGWSVEVLTGRSSFLVGDNERQVDTDRGESRDENARDC